MPEQQPRHDVSYSRPPPPPPSHPYCSILIRTPTFSYAEGHGHNTVCPWHAVQTTDEVRQVVQHTEIVLNNDNIPRQPDDETMTTRNRRWGGRKGMGGGGRVEERGHANMKKLVTINIIKYN